MVESPAPVPPPTSAVPFGQKTRISVLASTLGAILGAILALAGGGLISAFAVAGVALAEGLNPLDQDVLMGITTRISMVTMSVALTGICLVGAAFGTAIATRRNIRESLGFRRAPWPTFLLASIGILALGPTSDLCVRGMKAIAPTWTFDALDMIEQITSGHSFWVLWPVIALMPGFTEEVFFRGLVQRAYGYGAKAIVISAVTFSLFHMDPHHIAGVLPLGFFLAWVGARTGSLWVTIVAHTVNNSFALLASTVDVETVNLGQELEVMPIWWAPVGWLIAGAAAYGIWKLTQDSERWRPEPAPIVSPKKF